ncbi:HAD superfamily hydrolase (TIGR01450 family) [Nocardioides luteus]|uniref:Haloacid dehalogenase n=1 Tax=Nocardioides luteus TaxID=1844 RepID=A0ABQ5T003_9ACTN|nr:HAD-IIA family hydrolase [Nocardioides luteus]MDR7310443.1 HAD superfamily hydrolase (TIGR01450 family) [Nocardioides luteus]GGR52684.1 haloacid dehalogenase [Nocardioides luteus]GLJ69777.1 haloacid dehalogenase [Nocardioides luteus]
MLNGHQLKGSDQALASAHDVAMLDLDGVVYIGRAAVPRAPESLAAAREAGLRLAFITNNAARPPQKVAANIRDLEIEATAEDVVTSAQAAARVLAERLEPGAKVVNLGAAGLSEPLEAAGLVPVAVDEDAEAIVTGYNPELLWKDILRAAVRIKDGLFWVASNTDMTFPAAYGIAPGHGVLVDTLRRFANVEPVVAGKPSKPLLEETIRRTGAEHPLMVGDRLDTDIEGGRNMGIDTLLVLTGVTGLEEIVAAEPERRPTYISSDLGGLLETHQAPESDGTTARLGGWTAEVRDGELQVSGDGATDDWWRVVATSAWAHVDATGSVVSIGALAAPPRPDADGGAVVSGT